MLNPSENEFNKKRISDNKQIAIINNNNLEELLLRSIGNVKNSPPQAFLDDVSKEAKRIEIINIIETPFFKKIFFFSRKIAIEKGHTIFNQHPV